mgnify:CR=1 FL=1
MDYSAEGFVTADDGTRLFYGVQGEGETVALVDGLGCDGFAWKYLQPHLAETHRVVHTHFRGHGRSGTPRDKTRVGIPILASDLRRVLDHLGIAKAVVLGHSIGTQVALELYRLAPERVRALGLICGSAGRVTHTFHGTDILHQILPGLIERAERSPSLTRALWGRVPTRLAFRLARLGREVDALSIRAEDFARYWDHVALMDPDLFLHLLRCAGEHSAEDLLSSIRVPTLVLAAERDTFTPPELAKRMADAIPHCRHVLLPGASHAAPVEQPVTIQRILRAFLDELDEREGVGTRPSSLS